MLDLAFHRGLLAGKHYAQSLFGPAHTLKKPRNPYWCPVYRFVWWLGYSLAAYDVLNDGR